MPRERERERALWDPVKKAFGDKGSPSRELKGGFTCWEKKKKKSLAGWKDIHEKGQNGAATTLGFPF